MNVDKARIAATVTAAPEPNPDATGIVDVMRSVHAGGRATFSACNVK